MAIDAIDLHLPDPGRIIAFSTRRNASDPSDPYCGFNVCHYTADSPTHVDSCRNRLCDYLHISRDRLILPRQTHSLNVAIIDKIPFDPASLEDVDALVTRLENVALCINTADCVPILMADPDAGVIAAVHSGWRGTVGEIATRTLTAMQSLGADPAHIHAAMGPSICPDCFEVGEEVAVKFRKAFGPGVVIDNHTKPHIDLPRAIASRLIKAGLPAANISYPPACSHCNPDTLFSARRHTINSGRTLSTIMLKKA